MRNTLSIISIYFLCAFFVSCLPQDSKVALVNAHEGTLHANSCMGGASYLVFNDKQYAIGSRSLPELNKTISAIGQGRKVSAQALNSSGCVKVYKIEFNGEFEKENSLTGYGNDEVRRVVQVYQFRLL